jgi:hypothetical protein
VGGTENKENIMSTWDGLHVVVLVLVILICLRVFGLI